MNENSQELIEYLNCVKIDGGILKYLPDEYKNNKKIVMKVNKNSI